MMLNKFLKQTMHYASGSLLLSVASLISFPILTRNLEVNEYGYLSLLTTLSGLLAAVYKLGLQQSIIRYYKNGSHNISSNILYSFAISAFFTSLFVLLLITVIPSTYSSNLILIVIFIALLQSLRSICIGLYMSLEKSLYVNSVNVLYKYGSLLSMLIFIFYYEKSAISVVLSILLVDVIILVVVGSKVRKDVSFTRPDKSDMSLVIYYGFPLMLVEVLQIGHAFTDRFLINHFIDTESVALYVAPHSISRIISDVVFGGVATALVPIYMAMWKNEDFDQARIFINKISDYFLYLFPISISGLYIISEPLMTILASDKYAESSYILPITFIGVGLFSSTFIYSAGLKIKKSQFKLLQYVFESLIINIILNYIFIKDFGITASAWSTVISYFWMSIRFYYSSKSILDVSINYRYLLSGGVVSICVASLGFFGFQVQNIYLDILIKILISLTLSVVVLIVISEDIKSILRARLNLNAGKE